MNSGVYPALDEVSTQRPLTSRHAASIGSLNVPKVLGPEHGERHKPSLLSSTKDASRKRTATRLQIMSGRKTGKVWPWQAPRRLPCAPLSSRRRRKSKETARRTTYFAAYEYSITSIFIRECILPPGISRFPLGPLMDIVWTRFPAELGPL